MNNFGIRTAVAALAFSALSLGTAFAEDPKKAEDAPAAAATGNDGKEGSFAPVVTLDDGSRTQQGSKIDDLGKWSLPDGSPTYKIAKDGTMDWYAYSGFRRYHSECHVCHGPEGEGSTYAPALVNSLKTMDYTTFLQTVASGKNENRGGTQFIMPALGDNKNVMCYVDDIYVYLKARADGVVPRGRPVGRVDITPARKEADAACNP